MDFLFFLDFVIVFWHTYNWLTVKTKQFLNIYIYIYIYIYILLTLDLKEEKGTDSVLIWESKGANTFKFKPLYNAFFHSIRHSGYKVGIKLDKDSLAVKQKNYTTNIVNAYIVYVLENWSNGALRGFALKYCLFVAKLV